MARTDFECYHFCVPPKRHPACWGTCPDYAKAKAKHEADKATEARRRGPVSAYEQRCEAINRATRKRRK